MKSMESELQAHHLIFMGDCNFRCQGSFNSNLEAAVNNYQLLLSKDEYIKHKTQNKILYDFIEGEINFKATYRRSRIHDQFSNKKEQSPSYTDRIYIHTSPHLESKIVEYGSMNEHLGSDHRPVYAQIMCQISLPFIKPQIDWIPESKLGLCFSRLQVIILLPTFQEIFKVSPTFIKLLFSEEYLEHCGESKELEFDEMITFADIPMLTFALSDSRFLQDRNLSIIVKQGIQQEGGQISAQALLPFLGIETNSENHFSASLLANTRKIGCISGSYKIFTIPK